MFETSISNVVNILIIAACVLGVTFCLGAIAGVFKAAKEFFFRKWTHRFNQDESTAFFVISGESAVVGPLYDYVQRAAAAASQAAENESIKLEETDGKKEEKSNS